MVLKRFRAGIIGALARRAGDGDRWWPRVATAPALGSAWRSAMSHVKFILRHLGWALVAAIVIELFVTPFVPISEFLSKHELGVSQGQTSSQQSVDNGQSSSYGSDRSIPVSVALSWCTGACDSQRFQPLETYGSNPNDIGIKLKPGPCVTLNIPSGYYGQNWDSVRTTAFTGPTALDSCEASIRRIG
jgi:hypothetical protein